MVAYHFPPLAGSSGIQRTLRLVQQLPEHGWHPLVLTTQPRAYERVSDDLSSEIPANTIVERAFALDTARHLAVGGRYIASLARPDRWKTWKWDAVRRGMAMIRRHHPRAIWTTYPIATAHVIGAELQRRSGLPWIADFRDPMAQADYPADPITRQQFAKIERLVSEQAAICTFTTPSACRSYQRRYPLAAEKMRLLENGYDEASFANAATDFGTAPLVPGRLTLLHSGVVYPSERDPTQLFVALARIKARGHSAVIVRFRAAVHDNLLAGLATKYGVADMVQILQPVPYVQALLEMQRADGLLLMQASNCNEQIPAKLYEYLRAGKPILCLSDPVGDTWAVLQRAGLSQCADIADAVQIETLLEHFVQVGPQGLLPTVEAVASASRTARTQQLVGWLDACAQP